MSLKERFALLYDSFSLRHRHGSAAVGLPDLTKTFRSRVLLFWRDLISGSPSMREHFGYQPMLGTFWQEIHNELQHLYGRPYMQNQRFSDATTDDLLPFLAECDTEQFFDFMEIAFKLPALSRLTGRINEIVDAMNAMFRIEELPYEMTHLVTREETISDRQENFGSEEYPEYDFDRGLMTWLVTDAYPQVIRVDDQVPHQEAIQPALAALSAPHFTEANKEFLEALRHYRNDEFANCLTGCGSALESVLKVLCDRNQWPYNRGDTLDRLLDIVVGEIPLDSFYKQALMVVGTARNRYGSAHGRGSEARPVPHHIAQHAITSTAAAITLITAAEANR